MYKLLLRKGEKEFFIKQEGKDMSWERKIDCEAFKLAIEGCERIAGYGLEIKEV